MRNQAFFVRKRAARIILSREVSAPSTIKGKGTGLMSEEIFLKKISSGALTPVSENDADKLKKFKSGGVFKCVISKPRNYRFLKKYFALLNHAYDCFEPDNEVGEKNFEQFRADIIILSGFYDRVVRVDNSTRYVPKSISFGSMSAEQFEELYSKTVDTILKHVLKNYTRDDIDNVVEEILSFT